jgi:hypothetical protein
MVFASLMYLSTSRLESSLDRQWDMRVQCIPHVRRWSADVGSVRSYLMIDHFHQFFLTTHPILAHLVDRGRWRAKSNPEFLAMYLTQHLTGCLQLHPLSETYTRSARLPNSSEVLPFNMRLSKSHYVCAYIISRTARSGVVRTWVKASSAFSC